MSENERDEGESEGEREREAVRMRGCREMKEKERLSRQLSTRLNSGVVSCKTNSPFSRDQIQT